MAPSPPRAKKSPTKKKTASTRPQATAPKASTSPRKSPRKKSAPTSAPEHEDDPSASSLLDHSRVTTDQWYKASSTTQAYANYVKAGKKWLKGWVEEGRDQVADDEGTASEERSAFADALDIIGEHTPTVLRLLTALKCDHQGHSYRTAEGLRSAFKDYFERVHGCQGDYWRYNEYTKKWEGIPVFEGKYKAYYESLKNRDNRTSTTTQALPMLPQDLKVIMDYLDSPQCVSEMPLTKRLYFKAFATTAFCLWTRNDELINLQHKDVRRNQVSLTGCEYTDIRLGFRKTNKDPNKSQHYWIPPDREHPEIDCNLHLGQWLDHLQLLLQRPLADHDYIFPAVASTGQLKFGEATSRSGFENLMDDIIQRSGVMNGRNGKFTTHCFRRGGAQYRFMWAARKWSLKAVKWWGGWSSNERIDTIMRYLLDELMAYEEGFGDILMADRASDRHETFMGVQDPSAVILKADLAAFKDVILRQLEETIARVEQCGIMPSAEHSRNAPAAAVSSPPRAAPIMLYQDAFDLEMWHEHRPSSPTPSFHRHSSPTPPEPRVPRIPTTKSLDDALRYWNFGDADKGLTVPLKSWPATFTPADYVSEAQKFSMIKAVCEEFEVRCQSDFTVFEKEYPGLRRSYTKLVKAVREARKRRGDTKGRQARGYRRN
ncbi:hypothetical protein PLICRDRAFT_178074 [Plicaturopsis crispa FD-325 SS-3]|nr:hypothetical protein PLICRDRAFT_178074 [Plicaturopsis crispa FD-325 SS-3]